MPVFGGVADSDADAAGAAGSAAGQNLGTRLSSMHYDHLGPRTSLQCN